MRRIDSDDVFRRWESLSLVERRRAVESMVSSVTILSGKKGYNRFDVRRVLVSLRGGGEVAAVVATAFADAKVLIHLASRLR